MSIFGGRMKVEQNQHVPNGSRSTAGNGGLQRVDGPAMVCVGIVVSAVGGGTLTAKITWSHDGVNFGDAETPTSFAAISTVKATTLRVQPMAPFYRLEWTITGGTVTFSSYVWAGGV